MNFMMLFIASYHGRPSQSGLASTKSNFVTSECRTSWSQLTTSHSISGYERGVASISWSHYDSGCSCWLSDADGYQDSI